MEAELIKENIVTSYPSANLTLNILAEGESIVPDVKKDIAEIILVEGKSFIEKTEIQKNRIIFTGCAEFTVLYTSDESDTVNSVSAKIPFNHIEECVGVNPDNKFILSYETVHSECLLVNSRKISVKSIISVNFISYLDVSIPLVTKVRSSEAEVKKETFTFSKLSSSIEESFTVSDFLELPPSSEPFDTLLLSRATLKDCSFKTVTGKAVAKGTLSLFRLYLTPEGNISHLRHELPFTEILDIPGLSEEDNCDVSFFIRTYTDIFSSDEASRQGFAFSADIGISAVVFTTEKLSTITDAYIPGMAVSVKNQTFRKSEVLISEPLSLNLKESVVIPTHMPDAEQILPVSARITDVKSVIEKDKITISGIIDVLIMYISSGSKAIHSFNHQLSFAESMESPTGNPEIFIKPGGVYSDFSYLSPSKLDLRCIADLNVKISESTDSFSSIDSINVNDMDTKKRPSIIIYFVKSGDTLWDIAKKYSTTTEKIMAANAIENGDLLNVGTRLLIPA